MQETNISKRRSRKEYEQGFIFSSGIFITGVILEWITGGRGTGLPSWPLNVQIGLSFIIILVFIHIYYRELNAVKWISRVPAAISAITLFSFLVLLMGLLPQNVSGEKGILHFTGLSHVRNSFPFLLSGLYLLSSLGLTALRRSSPLNLKNIGFLLNHTGLWIIVFAGSLGAGDLKRVQINIQENETVWYGHDANHQIRQLPFNLKLIDFTIVEYNPRLAYIKSEDLSFPPGIENNLLLIEPGMKVKIKDWSIEVKEFLHSSKKDSVHFYPSSDSLTVPSAFLRVQNMFNKTEKTGWISCGNFMTEPEFFRLDSAYSLAMTTPEAKTYSSIIEIMTKDGKLIKHDLQVNKPLKISGWNLYQLSYDESKGKWSELSIIEAIRDPWLVVIYIGIFMVLAGALYMFWLGKN